MQLKYLLFLDETTNAPRLAAGFILGEFPDREAALRMARCSGLKLTSEPSAGRPPDPPAAAAESMKTG
jgi:hypothetical protein